MATKLEKFDSFDNTQELDLDSVRKAEKKQDSFYDLGFYKPKETKFPDELDPDEVPEETVEEEEEEESKPWMNKPEKKKKKKVKKGVIIGAIVAGAVVLLSVAGFFGYKIYSDMKDAEGRLGDNPIPSFVGDPLSDAEDWASAYKDVVVETTEVFDEEVQAGDVISQDTETDADGNTVLNVKVSKGKDPEKIVALPKNLNEMTEPEIREWFATNGFINVTYSYTLTEDVPEGRMISISTTEPEVARNTAIEIVICGDGPTEVKSVELQDFSQMTPAQVTTYAAENGLVLDLQYELSNDKAKDQFIRQSPAAGTILKTGDKFTVIFSSDTKISIPNVMNMTEDQARQAASERNLNFSVTYAYNDNIVEGNVITQDPIANAVVYNNGELKVVVSRGRPTIEDFKGKTPDELRAAINALNANGAQITVNHSEAGDNYSSYPEGTIMDINKSGVLNSIDTIVYSVSKGERPRLTNYNSYVGWTFQQVSDELDSLGVRENRRHITETYNSAPAGQVISCQTDTGGIYLDEFNTIYIEYSLGELTEGTIRGVLDSYVGKNVRNVENALNSMIKENQANMYFTTRLDESSSGGASGTLSHYEIAQEGTGFRVTLYRY